MDNVVRLGPTQAVLDRPFTDPALNDADLAIMRRIVNGLCSLLDLPVDEPPPGHPFILRREDHEGRAVRLVLCDRDRLMEAKEFFVVGFFGHRRTGLDVSVLNAVDEDLIHEFPHHPGVLAYCSVQMADGNYVNVVLMATPDVRDDWRTSVKHAYAARDLAPEFYTAVRLQNARLTGDLIGGQLSLTSTKYYDYSDGELWRAIRDVEAPR